MENQHCANVLVTCLFEGCGEVEPSILRFTLFFSLDRVCLSHSFIPRKNAVTYSRLLHTFVNAAIAINGREQDSQQWNIKMQPNGMEK